MGRLIRSVLVPNRGEIAVRIARCCREIGARSVLAAAEDDLGSYASRFFDEVVSLGSGDARQTYLNVSAIMECARSTEVDAIHPGYGFLSERPALAAACEENDIVFVGPRSQTIALMGSKAESRRRMAAAGVPVIPGYDGEDQTDGTLQREAKRIGFPLMIKPSGGGGGKGMKVVERFEQLSSAMDSARREAASAFGEDRLLLEQCITQPRHIEFQVFGDAQGNVLHLFERDCSIQRRHQKVIEETPAPHFSDDLRKRMGAAAVAAASAVDYLNAGTVEFIVTPENDFFFLEMNTRIQVEHPVTELSLDVDLVRAQFTVAEGRPLPWRASELRQRGHAMECRLYAEDPDGGFLPQAGTIRRYRPPSGPGIRVDSGVREGDQVLVNYDPMLAKVIACAEDRQSCINRLSRALAEFTILGINTNAGYLRRVLAHPEFRAGRSSTDFLARHAEELQRDDREAVAVAAVIGAAKPASRTLADSAAATVWENIGPWGRW